jgi:hypothetical protein
LVILSEHLTHSLSHRNINQGTFATTIAAHASHDEQRKGQEPLGYLVQAKSRKM